MGILILCCLHLFDIGHYKLLLKKNFTLFKILTILYNEIFINFDYSLKKIIIKYYLKYI